MSRVREMDSAVRSTVGLAAWLCPLLQAGDSFYPTGSYAHSFGLEGLIELGVVRDRATLGVFLDCALVPALRRLELPLAARAYDAFGQPDWERVRLLGELSSAAKAPRELRAASEAIGRQRAELAATVHGSSLARAYLERAAAGHWPHAASLSAGLEGRVFGSPREAVLCGVTYASVAAVLSAAMKLLRLGQNTCQSLLAEVLHLAPDLIAEAVRVPLEEIGWVNPWLDIAAARHESANARMFIS